MLVGLLDDSCLLLITLVVGAMLALNELMHTQHRDHPADNNIGAGSRVVSFARARANRTVLDAGVCLQRDLIRVESWGSPLRRSGLERAATGPAIVSPRPGEPAEPSRKPSTSVVMP